VFERELNRIRDRVRRRQYVVTLHADEEMNADELTVFDIEHCVATGRIIQRQRDRETGEWKYGIRGKATDDRAMDVIVKKSPRGSIVFITVYLT
jgi:hypothetical protein